MTNAFSLVNRTDDYTPCFRNGEGFQELWSVDLNGNTVGVIRRIGNVWSARAYDGKLPNGWARHVLIGDRNSKEEAAELIQNYCTSRSACV